MGGIGLKKRHRSARSLTTLEKRHRIEQKMRRPAGIRQPTGSPEESDGEVCVLDSYCSNEGAEAEAGGGQKLNIEFHCSRIW